MSTRDEERTELDERRERRRAERRQRRVPPPSKWLFQLTYLDVVGADDRGESRAP